MLRQLLRLGLGALPQLRDPEIEQLHVFAREQATRREHHDVVGLEIAVNDTEPVRVFERGEHGTHDRERPLDAQLPAAFLARALDQATEGLAFEKLHGEEQAPVALTELDDLDDVGMGQLRRHLGLALEPLRDLLDSHELGVKQLQRDGLARGESLSAKHHAHAPLAYRAQDAVAVTEGAADEGRLRHGGSPSGSRGARCRPSWRPELSSAAGCCPGRHFSVLRIGTLPLLLSSFLPATQIWRAILLGPGIWRIQRDARCSPAAQDGHVLARRSIAPSCVRRDEARPADPARTSSCRGKACPSPAGRVNLPDGNRPQE